MSTGVCLDESGHMIGQGRGGGTDVREYCTRCLIKRKYDSIAPGV